MQASIIFPAFTHRRIRSPQSQISRREAAAIITVVDRVVPFKSVGSHWLAEMTSVLSKRALCTSAKSHPKVVKIKKKSTELQSPLPTSKPLGSSSKLSHYFLTGSLLFVACRSRWAWSSSKLTPSPIGAVPGAERQDAFAINNIPNRSESMGSYFER